METEKTSVEASGRCGSSGGRGKTLGDGEEALGMRENSQGRCGSSGDEGKLSGTVRKLWGTMYLFLKVFIGVWVLGVGWLAYWWR